MRSPQRQGLVTAVVLSCLTGGAGAFEQAPLSLAGLARVYEQGDFDAFEAGLRESRDLRKLASDLKSHPDRGPSGAQRRTAFVFEIGSAALLTEDEQTRAAGAELFLEHAKDLERTSPPESFECEWRVGAVGLFEGRMLPDVHLPFLDASIKRCPRSARLRLAVARAIDRDWTFDVSSVSATVRAGRPGAVDTRLDDATSAYGAAMDEPETADEARVRLAWLWCRRGELVPARTLLEAVPATSGDGVLVYFRHLLLGQVLELQGDLAAAAQSLLSALDLYPTAQSAKVLLMGTSLARGRIDEARSFATEIEVAGEAAYDPWWLYWSGDLRRQSHVVLALRVRQ